LTPRPGEGMLPYPKRVVFTSGIEELDKIEAAVCENKVKVIKSEQECFLLSLERKKAAFEVELNAIKLAGAEAKCKLIQKELRVLQYQALNS